MRNFILLISCVLFFTGLQSQPVILWSENFDVTLSGYTFTPSNLWISDPSYSSSSPNSMHALIPSHTGDSSMMTTSWYNFEKYSHLLLTFKHICKVSASDIVTVEYQINQIGATWTRIPMSSYDGSSNQYKGQKFSHQSYSDWMPKDSLAIPTNSWWKTETFDLSAEAGWEEVRFRFKIKRGTIMGTQFAYGWLLDDIQLWGANSQIKLPTVQFLSPLVNDTVYSTGPYVINAKVASRTMAPIITPVLYVSYTFNNVTTYDSIVMTSKDGGDSLWYAILPQKYFNTFVTYSITGKDTAGNVLRITSHYYIKRATGNTSGEVIVGNGNLTQYYAPYCGYYEYGWAKMLYLSSEIIQGQSAFIDKMSWQNNQTATMAQNQSCYFKAVDEDAFINGNWVDPGIDGATLVWSGTYSPNASGWITITLNNRFLLPAGKNLLVYWLNKKTDYDYPYPEWVSSSTSPDYRMAYNVNWMSFPTSSGTMSYTRPNIKLNLVSVPGDSNSVSLAKINSPKPSVIAGQSTLVNVGIKNSGFKNLLQCTINWTLNGVLQTPYSWTGNLPDDFQDTSVLIGSYTPKSSGYDTLVIWVSMPNGVADTINFDDTLRVITFGCGGSLTGNYIIGNKAGANFSSFDDAIKIISMCGASGDIRLQFQSGYYDPISIPDLSNVMGGHALTITSLANNPDSVKICRSNGTYSIYLDGVNNLFINSITIYDTVYVSTNTYGIQMTNNITNLEIRNCNFFFDTLSTDYNLYAPIYKGSSGVVDSLRIINNRIMGGYYGIYLYGGNSSSVYGTNIYVDSNIIINQMESASYIIYSDIKSFSHNTVLTRIVNANSYWNGLYFDMCNFLINGNIVRQRTNSIYNIYFVTTYYAGIYNASGRSLFSNNEIIGYCNDYSDGMNFYNSAVDIYNNSMLYGGTGSTNCIYIAGSNVTNCKNNIFINLSPDGYPIYVGSSGTYAGDYNNYYSPNYIGYYNSSQSSMSAWITATGNDAHSVSLIPIFLGDSTQSLKLFDYTGISCPALSNVSKDIEGVVRAGQTGMGAYTFYPTTLNAACLGAANWNTSIVLGQQAAVNAVVVNMGTDSLVSMVLNWSVNGVQHTAYNWSGLLRIYDQDTAFLGNVSPVSGINTIKVWTSLPNNGLDDNNNNDTAVFYIYGCDSLYYGNYNVGGTNAHFTGLDEALTSINNCGLGGPTVLLFDTGTYAGLVIDKPVKGMSSINTLTFASQTGNPEDVRFTVATGAALTLSDVSNFYFKDISFDATIDGNMGRGVYMSGKCVNIEFRNCHILASPSSSSYDCYSFYKTYGSICDSIRLIGNLFSGGYYGMDFEGQSSGSGGYNTNIFIDSNIFEKAGYYSYYFYYTDLNSFSYNKIYPRNGSNNHYTYFYYTNHYHTVGNVWDYSKTNIEYAYNYFYYPHYANFSGTGLIANNEIILSPSTMEGYGMFLGYTNGTLKIYHNSIYNPGSSSYSRGIYANCGNGIGTFEIMNNNIWSNGYPIYVNGTGVTVTSDYNNFYSTGSNIGYFNTDCQTLSDWSTASNDVTSVNVAPQFLDISECLELVSVIGLGCPQINPITTDILGNTRNTTTTIGCYEYLPKVYDVAARKVSTPSGTLITGTTYPTAVLIRNYGSATITSMDIYWSINGVAQAKYVWSGTLVSQDTMTVSIGNFNAITGNNTIKIWTSIPNGQSDERPANDTARISLIGCDSLLTGSYTLGSGGTFVDMNALTAAISNCGIGGPVIVQMLPGKYSEMLFNNAIPGTDSINTITFTSYHNNADSVIIESTTGNEATIKLSGGASYLIFDKLTVNGCMNSGTSYSKGFDLAGCSDIVIRNCKINILPDDNYYSDYSGISSNWQNGQFEDVWVENNEIRGAQYGIYLEPSTLSGPIYFRNNIIVSRYVGFCSYSNTILPDISYNTITFDTTSSRDAFYLFECYGTYGNDPDTMWMVGNKFRHNSSSLASYFYNYCYFSDFYPNDAFIMANNEFYIPNNSNINDAYFNFYYNDNIHFINNTLLTYLSSGYINLDYGGGKTVIINNNLVNFNGGDLLSVNGRSITGSDYNNMYSTATSLSDWQATTGQDVNSVSLNPFFTNPSLNLDLMDDSGLGCPRDSLAMRDIKNILRDTLTTMGAYQVIAVNNNLSPQAFISPTKVSLVGNATPVILKVYNPGINTVTSFRVDWIVNGVAQTYYPWTGSLSPKSSVNINLGTFTPVADDNTLLVFTSLPNGQADAVPTNDTLRFITKGCDSLLHGNYIVNHDTVLTNMLDKLLNCGISGPVTIQLASGTYSPIMLTNEIISADTDKTVTFTSLAGNPDSVVFFTSNYGQPVLSLKTNHVKFDKLTFDGALNQYYVVEFTGGCTNVEFYGCKILSDTVNSDYNSRVVFKDYNTGVINNIRFIKNNINGGYFGIYLYGGNGSNAIRNIIIDSNVIQNAYYYGMYFEYTELTSMSHNTILSRETNTNSSWYGINSWDTKYKFVNANKIHQRSSNITNSYGMYGYYSNSSDFTNDTGFISNNEIVLIAGYSNGMYFPYSKLEIYHNSIYIQGSGNSYGIYVDGNDPLILKNNISVTPSGGYPIYVGTSSMPFYADYNNYYGGGNNIGQYNYNTISSMASWQTTTGQDAHSVSAVATFEFSDTAFLGLSSASGFYCPVLSRVSKDITGKGRFGFTAMGAYTNKPVTLDAAIIDVVDWSPSCVIGATTPVKAVLMNLSSSDTLSSVTIGWSVRGTNQTAYNWNGTLLQYETDTILLGNFLPIGGDNEIRVWSSNPNSSTDLEPANDTIAVSTYGCDSLLHGIYTVGGVGADFATISDASVALNKCGINGPTEFRLAPGSYDPLSISGNVLGSSSINTITFTSANFNANSVKFTGSTALYLSSTHNLNFRYLTFGDSTGNYGVNMEGACNNIEFYHCVIQMDVTSSNTSYAFYKPSGSACDDFRFIGNIVDGGYYGFYFYGKGTSTGGYNTNVRIDSNVFNNVYSQPYYFYYTDLTSFSYNLITARQGGSSYMYAGSYYTNHNHTVGNKWNTSDNTNLSDFSVSFDYANIYNASGRGLFANNEIINTASDYGDGISIYSSNLDVYHNSVFSAATNWGNALYIDAWSGNVVCKNNQFFSMGIPVMVYEGDNVTLNNNNYYSPTGSFGEWDGTTCNTLNDWINESGDTLAKNIAPLYVDSTTSLELTNYTGMSCQRMTNILTDINNNPRSSITTLGAYSLSIVEGYNVSIAEITEPVLNTVVKCYPNYSTVKAALYNNGTMPVDFSVNPVSLHVIVTGPTNYQKDTIISVGTLSAMAKDTITITHLMPTSATGQYDISVWVDFALDTIHGDDTATSNYLVERVTLPYDVNFDSVPQEMAFQQIQGNIGWEVIDSTGAVLPPFYGTGRLAFKSSTGLASMARAYIKQVDLQGTSKPTLNFWYQHDNSNPSKPDQIDIVVSTDGGNTFNYIYTTTRYDANATSPMWKLHQVDLSFYIQSTCLLIGFEGQSFGGGDQFIDRIFIEVQQDLVPTEIRLPSELYACDLSNKPIEVIVANTTIYAVEMDKDTINLTVQITTPDSNTQTSIYRFLGKIPPMSSDTILVHPGFDFSQKGTYTITAYIDTIKITTDISNDTITRIVNVYPDINLVELENMGDKRIGDTVYAKVKVKNTGNLLVPETPLRLQINNSNDIVETIQIPLNPGDSILYTFTQPYFVPSVNIIQPYYQVSITSELSCDYKAENNKVGLLAKVNVTELQVLSIETPNQSPCDTGFTKIYPKIELSNNGNYTLENVKVFVKVDSASIEVAKISEIFTSIPVGEEIYTFTSYYKVPNLNGKYDVKVYIDKIYDELDASNDTLDMEACAILYGTAVDDYEPTNWSMGQNIPNPSSALTQIPYSIPQDGTIHFSVMTITGQVLYTKDIPALVGTHLLEFETQLFADGIYYYSMEYQGQRIVKKMTIQK